MFSTFKDNTRAGKEQGGAWFLPPDEDIIKEANNVKLNQAGLDNVKKDWKIMNPNSLTRKKGSQAHINEVTQEVKTDVKKRATEMRKLEI
jgi:hypothetical protein